MCKSMGKAIDRWGVSMQGKKAVKEERRFSLLLSNYIVLPTSRVLKYQTATPCVCNASYVATTATVSGDVCLGANSSLGYGSVLRGIYFCFSFDFSQLIQLVFKQVRKHTLRIMQLFTLIIIFLLLLVIMLLQIMDQLFMLAQLMIIA